MQSAGPTVGIHSRGTGTATAKILAEILGDTVVNICPVKQ